MAEASNSQNDQTELTMCDVLEEEQELEDDANAVLGGSDDTNCSYDKGYVPRQALYACLTCSVNQEPGGVCLACSYKCHDGHEIVELYTKRNFRCDCGNSKFPGKSCSLKSDKDLNNPLNKYNQNFKGLYCSCSRPYPDLEDDTPDEMIQCVICEDWYHGRHIGSVVPEDYFEMICSKCMESHKFLYSYLNKFHYISVNDESKEERSKSTSVKSECAEGDCKIENEADPVHPPQNPNGDIKTEVDLVQPPQNPNGDIKTEVDPVQIHNPSYEVKKEEDNIKIELSAEILTCSNQSTDPVKNECEMKYITTIKAEDHDECLLKKINIKPDGIVSGPAFWPENWRKELCRCLSCMDMYAKYDCVYLLNVDDTILAYEERGKSSGGSQYDKGLTALSQLDRVKQMEAIRAYTSMKGQLKEYLREFADNKRTVCESDIKEFFDRIGKRQKLNGGVPHFCR